MAAPDNADDSTATTFRSKVTIMKSWKPENNPSVSSRCQKKNGGAKLTPRLTTTASYHSRSLPVSQNTRIVIVWNYTHFTSKPLVVTLLIIALEMTLPLQKKLAIRHGKARKVSPQTKPCLPTFQNAIARFEYTAVPQQKQRLLLLRLP